jgi:hypothetical protein
VQVRVLASLNEVSPGEWDALERGASPFLSHAYLAALEASGAVGEDTGWIPMHLALEDEHGRLRAALPLYAKHHSWGEFVFDFAWAEAYDRAGIDYYPKLVAAVPYTPVPGPRVLLEPGQPLQECANLLIAAAREVAGELPASSLHVLFPDDGQLGALEAAGMTLRRDCQFHWIDEGYGDFEGFLDRFTAEKRKKLRRERRRVAEAGIRFEWHDGHLFDGPLFDDLYRYYASSFLRRGMAPYFPPQFWRRVTEAMPERIRVVLARLGGQPVACAIFFVEEEVLYGRYWGCDTDFHSLHFETCFYQGIELALALGCRRFEPGAQGEHKLRRGFRPVPTWSAHWLAHPAFARAVNQWLTRERTHVEAYTAAAERHLPFRRDTGRWPAA